MIKFLRATFQVLISSLLLFVVLEAAFRIGEAPPGTARFIERIVYQEKLSTQKPKDEYRIFVYGESTFHGAHYAPISSPPKWLEAYLKDFLPERKIRIVNFCRLGRGTDFALNAFRDTLAYKPDLAVFYLGHNDFLYRNRKDWVAAENQKFGKKAEKLIRKSRFVSSISRWIYRSRFKYKREKPEDTIEFGSIEVSPLTQGAENITPRSKPFYWENVTFFRENILAIHRLARARGVHTLFFKPVSNLKDFAPFHSVHMKELTREELLKWRRLREEGIKKQKQDKLDEALALLTEAYSVDPTRAKLCFRLGQIYFAKGEFEKAKKFFEEARDNDAIVFRATKDILESYEEFRKKEGLELIDTEKILIQEVPSGILGEPVIEDNVHFSLKGHSLVGRALAQEIADRNWIAPEGEWKLDKERSYDEIAKELGIDEELQFSADLRMVHYSGSRYENRIRWAKKALETHPHHPSALRHLAWSYWLDGEVDKALEVYQELKELNPQAFYEVMDHEPGIKEAYERNAALKNGQS